MRISAAAHTPLTPIRTCRFFETRPGKGKEQCITVRDGLRRVWAGKEKGITRQDVDTRVRQRRH